MNEEDIKKSILEKTMKIFDYEYTYGFTEDNKICTTDSDKCCVIYENIEDWLCDWEWSIGEDIRNDLIYLTKRELFYIYNFLNKSSLGNKDTIETLEEYLCKGE